MTAKNTDPHPPLCFILMPFGIKPATSGKSIDFDSVYHEIIEPAVIAAGLEPLRADQEKQGGFIHKAMYERLILCDYAVADLTTANANVFYELGVRHAVRPSATVLQFAEGFGALPFDVNGLRGLPYQLRSNGKPSRVEQDILALSERLINCREDAHETPTDSPIFQLLQGFPDIKHLKTDVFRDRVRYSEKIKSDLANARALAKQDRKEALATVKSIAHGVTNFAEKEPGVLIDFLLSYRAVEGWQSMIELVETFPRELADTVLVQEQYALALNRANRGEQAERLLLELIEQHGPSSESYGILGRVYKDKWDYSLKSGSKILADGYLNKAVDAYLKGFETDWRDAYPGINALTLMEHKEPPDPRRLSLNGVVSYAVERKIAAGQPDYWDYATLLELAVLSGDSSSASSPLASALAAMREPWEAQTTARNLCLIRDLHQQRGEDVSWENEIIAELESVANGGE